MRTYYKLHLHFPRTHHEVYWYSDEPLHNKNEIVAECVREKYLLDTFTEFVSAVSIVSREEYLENMYED